MSNDLKKGKSKGQFVFDDLECTADLLMGASAGSIEALRRGVGNAEKYMDSALATALRALGRGPSDIAAGVDFSRKYLRDWLEGALGIPAPNWAGPKLDATSQRSLRVRVKLRKLGRAHREL
jgi:hypothetical protein